MKPPSKPNARAMPARLIIADDHMIGRAELRAKLEGACDLTLVGEATNGREAVVLCQDLRPDLVLLNMRMSEMDGLAAAHAIHQTCTQTRILIVTTHGNPETLLATLNAGAAGYVLKRVTRQELLITVQRVLRGESVLNGKIAVLAIQRLAAQQTSLTGVLPKRLTPREHDVLAQIVAEHSNLAIAQALSLSVSTIKIHVSHIIAKLGVADRKQAAVCAIESGRMIRPD